MAAGECSCNEDGLFFPSALYNTDEFFFFSFSRLLGVGKIADIALLVCETGMLPPACSVASILGFGLEWSTVWGDTKAEGSWRFQLQQ